MHSRGWTVPVCSCRGCSRAAGVRSGVFAFPGRTPAITSQLASPIRRPIGFRGRRGVQSLPVPRLGSRKRKSARTAERCQGRDDDAGPGEVALVESPPPAPQSKPVTLAPRLVARTAPLVAFGLGLRILAAGPAPISTVLRLRALCEPTQNSFAINHGARPRLGPIRPNCRLHALVKEYGRSRAVIGRCCSNPSRKAPGRLPCLSSTSRAVSSKATETPFTRRTRPDLRGSW